jgi:23S rRNA-/tRNA-specific pseudouridylate synthase
MRAVTTGVRSLDPLPHVQACLAWHVAPPRPGTPSVLRRPNPVHRIDRGTSGLLLCAKTKPAMMELSRMFKERRVQKTCECTVRAAIDVNRPHTRPTCQLRD